MLNKSIFSILLFLLILSPVICSEQSDELFNQGKFQEALNMLETEIKENPDNSDLLWQLGKTTHALIKEMDKDKDIINTSSPVIDLLAENSDKAEISDSIKARIIYWKTALMAVRGKAIGIRKSLKLVPVLFENADKSIALDKEFVRPYFLKAMVDDGVPGLLGGDKFRMVENIMEVIKRSPEDISYYVESALAIKSRDWSIRKKQKMTEKNGKTDGSPVNLEDKDFAKQILERAVKEYEKKENPSYLDTNAYNEALELLKD